MNAAVTEMFWQIRTIHALRTRTIFGQKCKNMQGMRPTVRLLLMAPTG